MQKKSEKEMINKDSLTDLGFVFNDGIWQIPAEKMNIAIEYAGSHGHLIVNGKLTGLPFNLISDLKKTWNNFALLKL